MSPHGALITCMSHPHRALLVGGTKICTQLSGLARQTLLWALVKPAQAALRVGERTDMCPMKAAT